MDCNFAAESVVVTSCSFAETIFFWIMDKFPTVAVGKHEAAEGILGILFWHRALEHAIKSMKKTPNILMVQVFTGGGIV